MHNWMLLSVLLVITQYSDGVLVPVTRVQQPTPLTRIVVASAPAATATSASPAAAVAVAPVVARTDEYDPYPQYVFTYSVHDSSTGDSKSQQESRQGDQVQGAYSLVEPDGTTRTVQYTADSQNGFNAVIYRQVQTHPVAQPLTPLVNLPPSRPPTAATPLAVEVQPTFQEFSAPPPEQETVEPQQTETPIPETPVTPSPVPVTVPSLATPGLIVPQAPQVAPQATFAIIPQPTRTVEPLQAFVLPQQSGTFSVLPPQATFSLGQQNPLPATISFLPQNAAGQIPPQQTIRLLQPSLRLPQLLQAPLVPVAVRPAPAVQDFPGQFFAIAPLAPRLPPLPFLQALAAAQPAAPQPSRLPQFPIFQTLSAQQSLAPQASRIAPLSLLQTLPSQPTTLQETVTSSPVTPATTQRPILQYTGVTLPYRTTTGTRGTYYEIRRH